MPNTDAFRIVVCLDGSDESTAALEWAVAEARLRKTEIVVVTAWNLPVMTAGGKEFAGLDPGAYGSSAQRTQDAAVGRVSADGLTIRKVLAQAHPAQALPTAAEDGDLLAVGRGHGGIAGLLLGSVSAHLTHRSPCTTVIVRPSKLRRGQVQSRT